MRTFLSILIITSIILFSCKKRANDAPPPVRNDHKELVANVDAYLKKQLAAKDYAAVDLTNVILSIQDSASFIRVAFKSKKIESDFILLKGDSLGHCNTGKFVHIQRDSSSLSKFNGSIAVLSFNRTEGTKKIITNNAVTLLCDQSIGEENIRENTLETDDGCAMVPSCDGCLPLVIVIGVRNSGGGGGMSFADMMDLSGILGSASTPASGSPSSSAGGGASGVGPSSSSGIYSPIASPVNASGGAVKLTNDVKVNFETSYTKPGIDVNEFMKCFASIPDAGASCSVTIYTDLPVDDNPDYIFNIWSGATGHVFLQLTKTNGAQSITQFVGKTTGKALAILAFSVQGKIVDNSTHKYNASLTMPITPVQLQTEINAIVAIGKAPTYNIWENNCVDYATGILNQIRPSDPLVPVPFNDPDTGDLYNTPQGLYLTLDGMKQQGGTEAKNITTNIVSRAGLSHGACN